MISFKKRVVAPVCMIGLLAALASGCRITYLDEIETEPDETTTAAAVETVINFAYSDDKYTEYFKMCEKEFENTHENLDIVLDRLDTSALLTEITGNNRDQSTLYDVYMTDSSNLRMAYLQGVAHANTSEDFTAVNYCDTALNAASVNGTLCGYPLSYDTTFLAYNTAYASGADNFATFEKLKAFSDSFEVSEELGTQLVQHIFTSDVANIFYNYAYFGAYISLGGECGDDPGSVSICNSDTISSAVSFLSILDYFGMDTSADDEKCLSDFVSGFTAATIVSTDDLATLMDSELACDFCAFPDYDASTRTAPLSITRVIAVNSYSPDLAMAEQFAHFCTFDKAQTLYEKTYELSCRNNMVSDPRLENIYESYAKSAIKTKLVYGEQAYPLIEIAIHNISKGGSSVSELSAVDTKLEGKLK